MQVLQTTVPCRRERCKDIEGQTFCSCTRCRVATRQAHPPRIRQTIRGEESKAGGLGAPPDWPGGRSSLEQSVFPRLAAALDATRGGSGGVWPMAKAKDRRIQSGEFNRAGSPEGSVVVSKTTRNANRAKEVSWRKAQAWGPKRVTGTWLAVPVFLTVRKACQSDGRRLVSWPRQYPQAGFWWTPG